MQKYDNFTVLNKTENVVESSDIIHVCMKNDWRTIFLMPSKTRQEKNFESDILQRNGKLSPDYHGHAGSSILYLQIIL